MSATSSTFSSLATQSATPDVRQHLYVVDALNLAQLFLGLAIALLNLCFLGAVVTNQRLRTSANILFSNAMMANLLGGVMLCIANIVDLNENVAILKPEGSLAFMNAYVTIGTLLTLISIKFVAVR